MNGDWVQRSEHKAVKSTRETNVHWLAPREPKNAETFRLQSQPLRAFFLFQKQKSENSSGRAFETEIRSFPWIFSQI